jgi:ARID/BRIGHT DNA binding domain
MSCPPRNAQNNGGQGGNPGANNWMALSGQPQNGANAGRPGPGTPTPIQAQSSPHPTGGAQNSPALVNKPQPPGGHQAGLPQRTEAPTQPGSQGPQMPHLPQQSTGEGGGNGGQFQMGQMGAGGSGAAPGMPQGHPAGMPNAGGVPNLNLLTQLISSIPPLEPGTFENHFKAFCQRRNRPFNPTALQIESRQVDLQALHAIVMQEGGAAKVNIPTLSLAL